MAASYNFRQLVGNAHRLAVARDLARMFWKRRFLPISCLLRALEMSELDKPALP